MQVIPETLNLISMFELPEMFSCS